MGSQLTNSTLRRRGHGGKYRELTGELGRVVRAVPGVLSPHSALEAVEEAQFPDSAWRSLRSDSRLERTRV